MSHLTYTPFPKTTSRSDLLDKLEKIRERFEGKKPAWPPLGCKDVTTHLAGGWLFDNIDLLLEELKK